MPTYNAFQVSEIGDKQYAGEVVQLDTANLPAGDVLIRVHYSSLNFKDALSASGNKGVTRNFPHTPGIDAAGVVEESGSAEFPPGTEVIVTGYDLGMNTAGGFGQYIRVPAGWVVQKPAGLSLQESMALGTAGFTAALCVDKLLACGLPRSPADVTAPVLVTGATGGVGSVAVALLHKLGYQVSASTGKPDSASWLEQLGAQEVIDRHTLSEENPRPLLKEQWAAAVDCVGGRTLFNVIKALQYGGSVAACGLTESTDVPATVFPFILRGVNLLGVDSVELPRQRKQDVWDLLAGEWRLDCLQDLVQEIALSDLSRCLQELLQGKARGRYVLKLDA